MARRGTGETSEMTKSELARLVSLLEKWANIQNSIGETELAQIVRLIARWVVFERDKKGVDE